MPPASAAERVENAGLIAHLPEHAVLWVQGIRTRSMGRTRYFLSPPLLPGRMYNYRVSVAWIEDGHWVSQTRVVPVQAGLIQGLYLPPAPMIIEKAAMRAADPAKAADRLREQGRGRRSLIVYKDLAKAVRRESEQAIC